MEVLVRARQVANYIENLNGFLLAAAHPTNHEHLGATLADAVLQAGINYRAVVLPRVKRLKQNWPTSRLATGFLNDLRSFGPNEMLNWKHSEKPRRLFELARFLVGENVDSEDELHSWLSSGRNRSCLLELRGIGPKTVDYLHRLVGGATVAVDRHLIRFVAQVCPNCTDYNDVHQVICYAADLLRIERVTLDHAIWRFMSSSVARGALAGSEACQWKQQCSGTELPQAGPSER